MLLVPNKLPPVEKTVTLSNIDTPKLARKTGSPANDEVCGHGFSDWLVTLFGAFKFLSCLCA